MSHENYEPTPRLRFVERDVLQDDLMAIASDLGMAEALPKQLILQQWWAEDMPAYMRDRARGEWRDVPLETE